MREALSSSPDYIRQPAIGEPAASSALPGVGQEFAIAGRPGERAVGDADHAPAGLRADPGGDALAHRTMDHGVAHHPTLADLGWPRLALRLCQRNPTRAR